MSHRTLGGSRPRGGRSAAVAAAALLVLLAPPRASAISPEVPRHFALLVGVDRVSAASSADIPTLAYAVKDADALKRELDKTGRYETTLLTNENADRRGIIRALARIARAARQQDTFLLYFAGHGVRNPGARRQTHWVIYGTTILDVEVDGMRMSHVLDYVEGISAGRKLVILDHCFSGDIISSVGGSLADLALPAPGGAAGVQPALSLNSRNLNPAEDVPEQLTIEYHDSLGVAIFGAAWSLAYESAERQHGVFTAKLLEAMTSTDADKAPRDGVLDVNEMDTFVGNWITAGEVEHLPQKGFKFRAGTEINWEVIDLTGTREQIDGTAARYLGLIESLHDGNALLPQSRIYYSEAVRNWQASLVDNRPPALSELQMVGMLSRIYAVRGRLAADKRGQILEAFLAEELGLPL